jgi:hypothetical protein
MSHAYVFFVILNFISYHKVYALKQDEKTIYVTSHAENKSPTYKLY